MMELFQAFKLLVGGNPGTAAGVVVVILGMCSSMVWLLRHIIVSLLAENRTARENMQKLVTNHIQHLASSQDSFATFQNNTIRIQESVLQRMNDHGEVLKGLRIGMASGFKDIGENISNISEKISEIKGKLG